MSLALALVLAQARAIASKCAAFNIDIDANNYNNSLQGLGWEEVQTPVWTKHGSRGHPQSTTEVLLSKVLNPQILT